MKTKSEARRRLILDVAADVFRESGFERSSMAEICTRVGGSKATLYNYFPSKEELFLEVMLEGTKDHFCFLHQALDWRNSSIREALTNFGEQLLMLIYSPSIIAVRRLAIAESMRSGVGQDFYERSRRKGEQLVAQHLQQAIDAGQLRNGDTHLMAVQWLALLDAELMERLFWRDVPEPDFEQVQAVTGRAVNAFLAIWGPIDTH